MKLAHTGTRACATMLLLWCLALPTIPAANDLTEFDPKQWALLLAQGDFRSAAAESDHAIAFYRGVIAADPEKGQYYLVGFYMCAKAQLAALSGDFVGADRVLSEAKAYSLGHPGFSGFLNPWDVM